MFTTYFATQRQDLGSGRACGCCGKSYRVHRYAQSEGSTTVRNSLFKSVSGGYAETRKGAARKAREGLAEDQAVRKVFAQRCTNCGHYDDELLREIARDYYRAKISLTKKPPLGERIFTFVLFAPVLALLCLFLGIGAMFIPFAYYSIFLPEQLHGPQAAGVIMSAFIAPTVVVVVALLYLLVRGKRLSENERKPHFTSEDLDRILALNSPDTAQGFIQEWKERSPEILKGLHEPQANWGKVDSELLGLFLKYRDLPPWAGFRPFDVSSHEDPLPSEASTVLDLALAEAALERKTRANGETAQTTATDSQEEQTLIPFTCRHCGKLLRVHPRYRGKPGTCKGCGKQVVVPMES
ncbi:MAG: hypothetical protein GY851_34645 [bacterium]|nr:hypothetical protein [bacterium]